MRNDRDDIIDWSSFDEQPQAQQKVSGTGLLKVLGAVLFVVAIAGVVVSGMALNNTLSGLQGASSYEAYSTQSQIMRWIVSILLSAGTLIPASFVLQMANNPFNSLAQLVLGVLGIVVIALLLGAGFMLDPAMVEFIDGRWIIFGILAIVYLVLVVLVRFNAQLVSSGGRHSAKDQLWDEKEIWK